MERVRKIRGKGKVNITTLDDMNESKDIADKLLYNSLSSKDSELQLVSSAIDTGIQSLCVNECCLFNHCITVHHVIHIYIAHYSHCALKRFLKTEFYIMHAVKCLRTEKSGGGRCNIVTSDNIINGT